MLFSSVYLRLFESSFCMAMKNSQHGLRFAVTMSVLCLVRKHSIFSAVSTLHCMFCVVIFYTHTKSALSHYYRYCQHWKKRFKEEPMTEFCSVININSKPGGKLRIIRQECCTWWYSSFAN